MGAGNQFAEAVPGVLVLASREALPRTRGLQAGMPIVVVWRQRFLDPANTVGTESISQLDRIRNVERHIAVEHQIEIGTHLITGARDHGNVRVQSVDAVGGAVGKRQLAAKEPELFVAGRLRAGDVARNLVLGCAAEELVDRFVTQLAAEIPEREINGADRADRQTLATVIQAAAPHLVPETFDIARVGTDQEPREMALDNETSGLTALSDADACFTCFGHDLDD